MHCSQGGSREGQGGQVTGFLSVCVPYPVAEEEEVAACDKPPII